MRFLIVLFGACFSLLINAADADNTNDQNIKFYSCNGEDGWAIYYERASQSFTVYQYRSTYNLDNVHDKICELTGTFMRGANIQYKVSMGIPFPLQPETQFQTELVIKKIYLDVGGTIENDPNFNQQPQRIPLSCRASI